MTDFFSSEVYYEEQHHIARTSATASESCCTLEFAKYKKAHEENITILIHSSTAFFFCPVALYNE